MLTSPLAHSPSPLECDVAILGGSGENDITIIGTDVVGGTSTFGPACNPAWPVHASGPFAARY